MSEKMEIVYGPVSSWRLGRSLGIDSVCAKEKICSFDCVYCSLGPTIKKTATRRVFVPTKQIAQALERIVRNVEADVVTFSGTGEPTLAQNLGEAIEVAGEISGLPIAVLTNSSLMSRKDVQEDLAKADIVKGKLDAPNEELFKEINRPLERISFQGIVGGMKRFQAEFKGKFALEVMFIPENRAFSKEIAAIAKAIKPDEIQINTPLRPSPIRPLTRQELKEVQKSFQDITFRSVYGAKKPEIEKVVGKKKIEKLKRIES